ncbi:MAG: LytTR family DNA-binding domain-containing protein [Bacteroidetes bacterium]|nr:LytTR family DNA-binding domain-containing protein [Bacteroidota bacterium]
MIRAIIIEDEKKSRETLRGLLNRFCRNVEVVAEADGFKSGLDAIRSNKTDMLFLDIQMPDGSGFRLLEHIEKIDFEIVFTTAFDHYAIKAIKYSALDYLLKPIDPDELVNAVKKVELKKSGNQINKNIRVLLDNIHAAESETQKIVLSTADKIHIVEVSKIIRCESDNYYTLFFLNDGKKILVSKTLKENEELLSSHNFIRPHKSHLINIRYIKSFVRDEGGYIMMEDGSQVPVSRRKREKILEIIANIS